MSDFVAFVMVVGGYVLGSSLGVLAYWLVERRERQRRERVMRAVLTDARARLGWSGDERPTAVHWSTRA